MPTSTPLLLSTAELAKTLSGGDDYIRTKGDEIKGLALRLDLNREAPDVIIVGKGPRIETKASRLVASHATVPAYVKRKTNAWEYLGQYHATAYRTDRATIEAYRHNRPLKDVAGILFLEAADKVSLNVRGGGFADPETRREIERAAVEFVTQWLRGQGYTVADRQREHRGYDILAASPRQTLKVEVKGTDASEARFFITRNERASSQEPGWRLAIVTSARTTPQIVFLTAQEAEEQFSFEALAWECKRRDPQSAHHRTGDGPR